jgi:hypothetical protein
MWLELLMDWDPWKLQFHRALVWKIVEVHHEGLPQTLQHNDGFMYMPLGTEHQEALSGCNT